MQPALGPTYLPPRTALPYAAAQVLLLLAIGWLLLTIVATAASQNILFDGAMNLEVSRSLAEGTGPRRLYDFNDYFPHGVQTKEPYVILGALVFKTFGVGPFQAHLPNIIFLVFLCTVVLVAIRRFSDSLTALAAILILLATPMMTQYGLNGYGELPSMVFGLSALAIVAWPGPIAERLLTRCLLAGLLAGLAITTKTVGAIQVSAVGLTLAVRLLVESPRPTRDLIRGLLVLTLGLAIPILLIEAWRWSWLGSAGYLKWWSDELSGILYQAGVTPQSTSESVLAKVPKHFNMLAAEIGRGRLVTAALFALPLVFAAAFISNPANPRTAKWWLFGLATIATCYMIWWMAITPTEKAWLRRIYIGLICLSLLGTACLTYSIRATFNRKDVAGRLVHISTVAIVLTLYGPFVTRAFNKPVSFSPDMNITDTLAAARVVSQLGPDALVFAHGWYAAPTVALHSGRSFIDFTDWPIGDFPGKSSYIVADRASFATGALDRALARYPNQPMLGKSIYAQVFQIDLSRPVDPFTEEQRRQARTHVSFATEEYTAIEGMEPLDPSMGGRWIESDSEILLRYEGQPEFELSGYMAPQHFYRKPTALNGRVILQGCPALPFAFDKSSWKQFHFRLDACRPALGDTIRVRILLNNALDLPLVYDHQRALLLGTIGFSGTPRMADQAH